MNHHSPFFEIQRERETILFSILAPSLSWPVSHTHTHYVVIFFPPEHKKSEPSEQVYILSDDQSKNFTPKAEDSQALAVHPPDLKKVNLLHSYALIYHLTEDCFSP